MSRINEVTKHLGNPIDFLSIKTMSQININKLFSCLNTHILLQSPFLTNLLLNVSYENTLQ